MHPGFFEFMHRARLGGHELFVVSHKTEYGHHDETRTPLREAALAWLEARGLIGDSRLQIPRTNVKFLDTRSAKIEAIRNLHLDYFVDDLIEVLEDAGFPSQTHRVWFTQPPQPALSVAHPLGYDGTAIARQFSWRSISAEILSELSNSDVATIIEHEWPSLVVSDVASTDGRGNSRVFRVQTTDSTYALKMYPDLAFDKRPRRLCEWSALELLSQKNLPVPSPRATSEALNWSLIEWIHGVAPDNDHRSVLEQATQFVAELLRLSRESPTGIGLATEACLRPSAILEQIDTRLALLREIQDERLKKFLDEQVTPEREARARHAKAELLSAWDQDVALDSRILSPSDFGFHNALVTDAGRLTFYDFEYFGWDDPVKLVADFVLHPGSAMSSKAQGWWLSTMVSTFGTDRAFALRLRACLPLYALRWTLILLNEFLPGKSRGRMFAKGIVESQLPNVRTTQLGKASDMLHAPIPDVHPSKG